MVIFGAFGAVKQVISNCRRTFGRFIISISHPVSEGFRNVLIPSQMEPLKSSPNVDTVTVTFKLNMK